MTRSRLLGVTSAAAADGGRRCPAASAGKQRGDALHDQRRRKALGGSTVRARGENVRQAERSADSDGHVAAGMGQLLTLRPHPGRARDGDRDDRCSCPHREHCDTVARLLERAVGAARAFRKDEQDLALVEDPLRETERLHVGGITIDRVDAAVRRGPADDRPGEQLLLAEPMDPPAELGDDPRPDDDGIEVGRMVGGDDHRAFARDVGDRAFKPDPAHDPTEDPAEERQRRDVKGYRAFERLGRRGRSSRRRPGRELVDASGLGVEDRRDDRRHGVLEHVPVGLDDPCVIGDPKRRDGPLGVQLVAETECRRGSPALRRPRDRGLAAPSAAVPAPRRTRGGTA